MSACGYKQTCGEVRQSVHLASESGHQTAFNTRRALSWLKRNRDRRFFLFFHSYEVHSPFTPRQRYIDRFLPENAEPPLASVQMKSNSRAKPLEPPWAGWTKYVDSPGSAKTLSQTGIARIRAIYDSEIRATDAYLEKLLGELERDNLLDDTVVVFTSDHGEAFFEHGRVGHGHLYADNLRVPLILRFPAKLPANAVIQERVQLADVVPTCLELLGVSVPTEVEGVSLVSRLTRDEPLPERAVISTGHIAGISYVTPSGGKLIAPLLADHAVGHPQYFELETDPGELDDRYPELDTVRIAQLRREVAVLWRPNPEHRGKDTQAFQPEQALAINGESALLAKFDELVGSKKWTGNDRPLVDDGPSGILRDG